MTANKDGEKEGTSTTVAVVIPNYSSVLGDGSESDDECVVPFQVLHLFWDCLIDSPGVVAPEKVRTLINSGSHTVIIDNRLVERLALRRRKLPEPLEISLAMGGKETTTTLNEWVKLKPMAINGQWKSRMIRAIIAKNLVCSVILGRPFLKANKMIIDHENSSCISKTDGYDILNRIQPIKEAQTKPQTQETVSANRLYTEEKQSILDELLQRTKRAKNKLDRGAEQQQLQSAIAAIRTQVEVLANEEQLKHLDKEMCKRFIDRFPTELPPIEDLPTNVYHRFKL